MKRTRNSRVNQVMYIASRISIVSFESEIEFVYTLIVSKTPFIMQKEIKL